MPIQNRFRSSRHRRQRLLFIALALAIVLVCGFIALSSRHRMLQENRQKSWFEQEAKARNEFKRALIAMFVFVDYRERLIERGLPPQDESNLKPVEVQAHLDEAKREAEELKPMLPGLADRQRFEKRLADLLKSLENSRMAAEAVAKAKTQAEIRKALNALAQ